MIFISVLLPAPFSPTRPWISPDASAKSTSRNASTPPKLLPIPLSSSAGADMCNGRPRSDQQMALHPLHPGRVGLGDDRPVGHDMLGDAARAGLLAVHHGGDACDDGAAMDAAGRVAHGGVHA